MRKKKDFRKIAFLGSWGAHRAAIACAKQVVKNDNDFYYISYFKFLDKIGFFPTLKILSTFIKSFYYCFKIPKYQIYFLNSPTALFLNYLKKTIRREKCISIIRVNNSIFSEKNIIKRVVLNILTSKVDGAIAVSDMIKDDILKKKPALPIEIFYSPLRDNKFFNIKPNLKNKNIICIGVTARKRKGTDIQIEVHKLLKKNKTYILGTYYKSENLYNSSKLINGLKFTGVVDPKIYLSKSAFLLHPARFDAGPNVVIEAMAAGVIPIISYRSGRTKMVSEIDKSLIIYSFNPHDYKRKIKELESLPYNELLKLSNKAKKVAKLYSENYTLDYFKYLFDKLVVQIENSKSASQ